MHPSIREKLEEMSGACRQFNVVRLDVFGSATRDTDFDVLESDVDLLVTLEPGARTDHYGDLKDAFERILGRHVDLLERAAVEASRNYIRRRRILSEAEPLHALVLDIVIAASDARSFVANLDWNTFQESRLHRNAVIRSLEIIGEAANKLSDSFHDAHADLRCVTSSPCGIGSCMPTMLSAWMSFGLWLSRACPFCWRNRHLSFRPMTDGSNLFNSQRQDSD